ncbi:MAG: hypothetical protein N2595_10545 [bacterium]|nr:hypothetical protein [bacterium]
MQLSNKDKQTLRSLAYRYSYIAHLDVQKERLERYYRTNALKPVRPVVLIDEVPWGEIQDPALVNVCDQSLAWLETHLRRVLYQWDHFQVDLLVLPFYPVVKQIRWVKGWGLDIKEHQITSTTGSHICAHAYEDQLRNEDDLSKLHSPEIAYDQESTEAAYAVAQEVFDGLLPVRIVGIGGLSYAMWDHIARYRGVENILTDLYERPAFMHATAQRFMQIARDLFTQLEQLELLDPSVPLVHCTPACAYELPAPNFSGHVRPCDVWGRCAAQIFGVVSPAMHDEFDLTYNAELFKNCGLLYYGCCEPLDRKIELLRKRFANLRKISITPWADPARAAEQIGRDFVMAAKPNPAYVSSPIFNPEPVRQEIARYCEAALAHGTTLEFVLKDISTIANNPHNLTQWAATVQEIINCYYG